MRSVSSSWSNTEVTKGQGSIKSAFISYVMFAWVLRLGCQCRQGHHSPLFICHLWNALHPLHHVRRNKLEGAFLLTHIADVSVPEFQIIIKTEKQIPVVKNQTFQMKHFIVNSSSWVFLVLHSHPPLLFCFDFLK